MIDARAIRAQVDLLELIGADTPLKKVATTRGGEYAGPCPFCGGDDRFRVQPAQGLWYCRQCSENDRWNDAIAYVERRNGLRFADACELLAARRLDESGAKVRAPHPDPIEPEPSAAWRADAEATVAAAIACLWSDTGARTRAYLAGRGLTEETIRRRELGLLHPGRDDRGISIPWRIAGRLWHVNVRRPAGLPKYRAIPGGTLFLYGADDLAGQAVAVLCEGEFDAMLLAQEAGDLAGVASLGSAQKGIGLRAMAYLLPLTRILTAYDNDKAGDEGKARLATYSRRFRPVRVPDGKDLTEFHHAGGNLREWAAGELARIAGDSVSAPTLLETVVEAFCRVDGWDAEEARAALEGFTDDELTRARDSLTNGLN